MADLATNLRSFLLATPAVTDIVEDRVHQSRVPQGSEFPHIWFGRTGSERDQSIEGGSCRPLFQTFALECAALDLDQAQTLADAVGDALSDYRGTFGDMTVQGVFVEDQSDDYEPYYSQGDEGVFMAALQIRIRPNE
jgi:hypothetical protein